jgi:hypothetical protein
MRIVNPSFGLAETAGQPGDGDTDSPATDWRNDPIVLFSNSKPNTREVLEGLKAHMGSFRSTDNIGFAFKDGAGQPAPDEVIDEVAGKYRGAILALAD